MKLKEILESRMSKEQIIVKHSSNDKKKYEYSKLESLLDNHNNPKAFAWLYKNIKDAVIYDGNEDTGTQYMMQLTVTQLKKFHKAMKKELDNIEY